MEWIRKNNQMLLELGGFGHVHQALSTFDTFDNQSHTDGMSSEERLSVRKIESTESSIYLSLAYLMVEVNMNSPTLVSELCAFDEPREANDAREPRGKLPFAVHLFRMFTNLTERNTKNYPVKKVRSSCAVEGYLPLTDKLYSYYCYSGKFY
jgi:hypothetical protein